MKQAMEGAGSQVITGFNGQEAVDQARNMGLQLESEDFICCFLQSAGYETASAFDADEGIEKVSGENPGLVILDVMMPYGLEGFTVTRKAREELNLVELPIIMLTAVHQVVKVPYRFVPDDRWLPVDRFLDKPMDPNKLLARIRELLPGDG